MFDNFEKVIIYPLVWFGMFTVIVVVVVYLLLYQINGVAEIYNVKKLSREDGLKKKEDGLSYYCTHNFIYTIKYSLPHESHLLIVFFLSFEYNITQLNTLRRQRMWKSVTQGGTIVWDSKVGP